MVDWGHYCYGCSYGHYYAFAFVVLDFSMEIRCMLSNLARASFSCSCGGEVIFLPLPGLVHGTTHLSQVLSGLYNAVKGASRFL